MDTTLLDIMAVFVGIAALAMLIQLGLLLGIFLSARAMRSHIERLMPPVEALLKTSRDAVMETRQEIHEIAAKTSVILDTARKQEERAVDLVDDMMARVRFERDRAEAAIDHTLGRVKNTADKIQTGVMKPVHRIQGLAAAVKVATSVFLHDNNHTAEPSHRPR